MNEFERAMAKTEKREHRKTLTLPKASEINTGVIASAVPKEKAFKDAIIEVLVVLPGREFCFTLVKTNVLSNVNPSKMNEAEFRKAIVQGLAPLLGNVK
jgi:hypothetical protein